MDRYIVSRNKGEKGMSRLSDLDIEIRADSECLISTCSSFEKFCEQMIRVNDMYVPSFLHDVWEEHVGSQEESPY